VKKYYKKEFMKLAGINNRQRLSQLIRGYENKKGDATYKIPPILKASEDYKKVKCECCGSSTIVFYESALKKIKQ
jgi:hypothetical protein